ncbi:MAG: hypothetical protein A2X86_02275 [Bdellovibrionales bacterium GWA2_49_15]|nr:MAG: hypothetical protein A2X86_02275 [Bdellovibrionales bacterium GWA2_49_15]
MLKKRNFINLWDFGTRKFALQLEGKVNSMPESPERFEVLFHGLKTLVEQNFSFSVLDQYPKLLEATLEAGPDLMRMGSRGISQYFWLGIFFELKWPEKKREGAFYQLLLNIIKRIKGRVWAWGKNLKHKLAWLLWQHGPADYLSYRKLIELEATDVDLPAWSGG